MRCTRRTMALGALGAFGALGGMQGVWHAAAGWNRDAGDRPAAAATGGRTVVQNRHRPGRLTRHTSFPGDRAMRTTAWIAGLSLPLVFAAAAAGRPSGVNEEGF